MALPNQTPSDKDALPDRRKATPRNEELAQLIGEKISAVMPTKEESSEQLKVFTAMKGYLEILAGNSEKGDGAGGDEESAFSKLGKLGKVFALVIGSIVGLLAAQLKTIAIFGKLFAPARLQVQIRQLFRGLTGTVKGFGASIRAGFSNLLKPLTGLFKGGAKGALGKTPQVLKNFMNGLKPIGTAFSQMFGVLKGGMKSLAGTGGMLTKVMGFFKSIGRYIGNFLKAIGSVARVASKVFLPLLIILTLFDTIKGAFEGFSEGGIIGGIAGAIKGLFNSLIFGPLDMIKGALAWVLDFFGMEKVAELLRSFSFADIFSSLIDGIAGFVSHIVEFITNVIMAPIRPIIELFNSLMNMFTNADGEGMFKNISDFFFDLILIIPKFFLNILDAVAGLFGFDGLKEKIYGMFDAIMDNFGIPAFKFKLPIIGTEIKFDGFFPFRDGEAKSDVKGGAEKEGGEVEAGEELTGLEKLRAKSKLTGLDKTADDFKAQTLGEDFENLSQQEKAERFRQLKENEETKTTQGGQTTVVNTTNVSNTANTSPNSIAIPKTSKNPDNLYRFGQKYAGSF